MNIPQTDLPRVVIIGAGFAGLNLAKKLDSRKFQIVLIDRNNYHLFQPLMYQVATAGLEPDAIAYPIRKTFQKKKNIHVRYLEVEKIDLKGKTVTTNKGQLFFDKLVIATGAKNNFFNMQDIEENSMPMKTLPQSLNIRSKILQNFEEALNRKNVEEREELMNIIIVGGGPTGVELAGALAELKNSILPKDFPDLDVRQMQLHLVEGSPNLLNTMSQKSSNEAETFLRKKGVNIWKKTHVKSYDGTIIQMDNGKQLKSNMLIWAAGVQANNPLLEYAEIATGRGKRINTNGYLQLDGYEEVYALGDVGNIQSENYPEGLPMLGSVAMQQGIYLAKYLNGRTKKEFKYSDKGTMATVGKKLAVVDLPNLHFKGFIGWVTWLFVHLMLLVGFRNRVLVLVNWTWNYFTSDRGNRLIVRSYKPTKKE